MVLFSFVVFVYVGNLHHHAPLDVLKRFVAESSRFFSGVLVESAFSYLFFLPFVLIPFLTLWVIFRRHFFKYRIQQITKFTILHFVHDVIESFFFAIAYVLLLMVQTKLADRGTIKLYNNVADHPWYAVPVAIAAWLVCEDTWFYWLHRLMHNKRLYRWVHASHHVSIDSTPFTQNAFNFVEGLLLPLGSILPTFIFPSWGPAYFVFLLLGGTANMIAHSGYEFYPTWTLLWKTTATHHNMHHQYFDGNYGTHFTFWDKVCNTEFKDYRDRFLEIKTRVRRAK
jgi:sterol desaturase/sphingolipid hydroxylase (fatty acid hydroxylase superfamily)